MPQSNCHTMPASLRTIILLSCILSLTRAAPSNKRPPKPSKAAYRFRLGKIKVTIVSDGPLLVANDVYSVPDAATVRSYKLNNHPVDPIRIQQNIVVLDTKTGRYIVDTGSLNTPELQSQSKFAGLLRDNLKKAGISLESIDGVLLTHGHVDHVSGLVDLELKPLFPKAKVYIGKKEHEFWSKVPVDSVGGLPDSTLNLLGSFYRRSVKPYLDRLVLVPDNGSPIPGIRFIPTPGHSPGHCAIEVVSGGRRLVIVGDTWVTEADQLQNPEWGFYLESDRVQAFESRIALLEEVAKAKDLVVVYHEQFPGLGTVRQRGPFFTWEKRR